MMTALLLGACAHGRVQSEQTYNGPPLPPPARVVVYRFATTPGEVRLNQGPAARLARSANAETEAESQARAARTAQDALTASLVRKLQSYGLPVEQASWTDPPPAGPALLVQGQILSIDEGNRARRVLIGFGAGQSRMSADSELWFLPPAGQPLAVGSFSAEADSGRAPGMAGTMGLGAATDRLAASAAAGGGLHVASEMRSTGEEANARRLADALGTKIAAFAASQGWIQSAVLR